MSHSVSFDRMQAVLFDMDGLIVDTEPIHFAAFREYMRRHGVDLPESVMPEFIGFSEQDNLRDLKAKYALDEPLEVMVADRRAIYLELVGTLPVEPLPGFWEFSAAARKRGMKQAVVSSAAAAQVEAVLGRLFEGRGLARQAASACLSPSSYFDAIVTGDDVTRNKPAPDIYLEGARRLRVPPALCLALEDSPPGAQSAAAAGMLVVVVPNKYTQRLAFPGAQGIVSSLTAAMGYLDW
ncbi:MAG: HAD family hydrolase [Armatimonadota bacterium]